MAHIGRKMGLFEIIRRKSISPDFLASSSGLYLPAIEAWASAAVAYGFIREGTDGKLWLPKNMVNLLLDKADPEYLGGQFSYLALRSLDYAAFEDLFRNRKTRPMSSSFEAIEEATHWDHHAFLRAIKRNVVLRLKLQKGCMLADVGCGTGSLLLKLCKEYPNSSYLGIDPSEEAVAIASHTLVGKSTTVLKMKAENMTFKEEFDIVYLGESLYAVGDKQAVLANCYASLKVDGILAIVEGLVPTKKITKENLLIMGMKLDFALQGHRFLERHELGMLLKDAGFGKTAFAPLGGSVYLTTTRK